MANSPPNPSKFKHLRAGLRACALVLLLAAAAAAAEAPRQPDLISKEPIRITADSLTADTANRTAEFSGHVEAVQGATVIRSDRLIIRYRAGRAAEGSSAAPEGAIERIEAIGSVVIEMGNRVARSQRAVYEADDGTLVLTGPDTNVREGGNTIQGSRITLYRAEDRIKVEGEGQRRVEAVFFPQPSPPSD